MVGAEGRQPPLGKQTQIFFPPKNALFSFNSFSLTLFVEGKSQNWPLCWSPSQHRTTLHRDSTVVTLGDVLPPVFSEQWVQTVKRQGGFPECSSAQKQDTRLPEGPWPLSTGRAKWKPLVPAVWGGGETYLVLTTTLTSFYQPAQASLLFCYTILGQLHDLHKA